MSNFFDAVDFVEQIDINKLTCYSVVMPSILLGSQYVMVLIFCNPKEGRLGLHWYNKLVNNGNGFVFKVELEYFKFIAKDQSISLPLRWGLEMKLSTNLVAISFFIIISASYHLIKIGITIKFLIMINILGVKLDFSFKNEQLMGISSFVLENFATNNSKEVFIR